MWLGSTAPPSHAYEGIVRVLGIYNMTPKAGTTHSELAKLLITNHRLRLSLQLASRLAGVGVRL